DRTGSRAPRHERDVSGDRLLAAVRGGGRGMSGDRPMGGRPSGDGSGPGGNGSGPGVRPAGFGGPGGQPSGGSAGFGRPGGFAGPGRPGGPGRRSGGAPGACGPGRGLPTPQPKE